MEDLKPKTKIKIRPGCNEDLENIYNCHLKCFEKGDVWYKSIIKQSLNFKLYLELLKMIWKTLKYQFPH
jgi:hypothetical protein